MKTRTPSCCSICCCRSCWSSPEPIAARHGIVRKPFDSEELASLVVACAEIRSRLNLGTMAIATMIAGSPFLA